MSYRKQNKPFSLLALLRRRTNIFAKRSRRQRQAATGSVHVIDDPGNCDLAVVSIDERHDDDLPQELKVEEADSFSTASSSSSSSSSSMSELMPYTLHISERLMSADDDGVDDQDDTWEWSMSGMSSIEREFNDCEDEFISYHSSPFLAESKSTMYESVSASASVSTPKPPKEPIVEKSKRRESKSFKRERSIEVINDTRIYQYASPSDDKYGDGDIASLGVSEITPLSFMTSYTSLSSSSKYTELKMKKRAMERRIEEKLLRHRNQRIPSSIKIKIHPEGKNHREVNLYPMIQ